MTAMGLAAGDGHAAILRVLARRGGDVDRPRGWEAPLERAVTGRHIDCVRTLIELGCDVNPQHSYDRNHGALWRAALACEFEIVRLLLAAGADPYLYSNKHSGPMTVSKTYSYEETMDLLISAMRTPSKRRTTLRYALRTAVYEQMVDQVRYLLAKAPDIYDEPDGEFREAPLYGAAVRGNAEILRLLLSSGPCDLEREHGERETALVAAVFAGRLEAIRVVVEAGARVSTSTKDGYTPLMCACMRVQSRDYLAIVGYLLAHGADVDARRSDGLTALLMVLKEGLYGPVEALLRRGPDLSVRDERGRSAVELARAGGRPEVIELFRRYAR